jgi:sensor histidine kinase YesM
MNRSLERVARLAAFNLAPAAVVTLVFSGVTLRTPPHEVLQAFLVALLFTVCIGHPCAILLPLVASKVCRLATPLYWSVMVASMAAIAAAGSLAALLILTAAGYLNSREVIEQWLTSSLKVAVVVTLSIGIVITMVETLHARLDEARLALRTKERDEAEARRLAAEARLASLESRVQPHFLFNTLNSIAALIPQDPAGAEKMTEQLASLLRSSLDTATSMVPLEQELKMVRHYLDIEHVRFGPRLRYDIRLDQVLGDIQVPRLSLQTLVENCVKYAVAPRREGGTIVICGGRSDGRVRLSVSDDGPGFGADALPPGHGLDLINERLRTLFGDAARLSIAGGAGRTTVSIELPA